CEKKKKKMEISTLTDHLLEDYFFLFQLVWALLWILTFLFLNRLGSSFAIHLFYRVTPFIFLPATLVFAETREYLYFQTVLESRDNDLIYENLTLWRFTGIVSYVLSGMILALFACRRDAGANKLRHSSPDRYESK
ncbi:MAG: hypothetical protein MI807_13420, partial [Verrucomicrobiales bacterium]|nr:hypothetical protein [Verrucomicrobiales bacterium]